MEDFRKKRGEKRMWREKENKKVEEKQNKPEKKKRKKMGNRDC